MFDVLNPLLAKYIDVGVLLVLLTPNNIKSDFQFRLLNFHHHDSL